MSERQFPPREYHEVILGYNSHYFTELCMKPSGAEEEEGASEAEMKRAEELDAILEAAFLVAASDGELSDAELSSLSEAIEKMSEGALTQADINASLTSFADLLDEQGYEQRIAHVASVLEEEEPRQMAFMTAVVLAYSDAQAHSDEGTVVRELAQAFGFSPEKTQALIAKAEEASQKKQ